MIASRASWSRRAESGGAAVAALAAVALFLGAWGLLHVGFYKRDQVIDTPIYQRYGDAVRDGQVPYRDFAVEYPPGALPAFVLPALVRGHDAPGYRRAFEALMWVCGAAVLVAMTALLDGLAAPTPRRIGALAVAALAPLALGSVVLTRFDLWPAALTVAALAFVVRGRARWGLGVLGVAVATKIYPAVLLPLLLAFVWRRRGRREALSAAAAFAAVLAVILVPFAALAPDGLASSFGRQASRPLQIESLGSSFLLAAHQAFGVGITMRSGHGSQNLVGAAADALAAVTTVLEAAALLGIWIWFARGSADRERLLRASAAAVCAFVALGKVFSPQFLIWLIPLVPLIRGRRSVAASGLFVLALALTQIWFPFRYWDLALHFDPAASWLVFARDLLMLGLLAALLLPSRGSIPRSRDNPRSLARPTVR